MSASFGTKSFPFCYETPGDRERNIVFGRPGRQIRGRPAAFSQILFQLAIFQKIDEQGVARLRNQAVQFVQVLTFHAQPKRKAFGDPISALRTLLRHPLQGGFDCNLDFSHRFARRLGVPCGHRHGFASFLHCPPYGDEGWLWPSYADRPRHRNTGWRIRSPPAPASPAWRRRQESPQRDTASRGKPMRSHPVKIAFPHADFQ